MGLCTRSSSSHSRTPTLISSTEVISHSAHRTIVLVGYGTGTVPGTNGQRYEYVTFRTSVLVYTGVAEYLVKWKGWGPYHASWEPASKVNAPALVQAYEENLRKQREYLDGVIDDVNGTQNSSGSRLDAEAFNQVDAVVCGLMCEMPEATLDWVADRWIERNVYS